MNITHASRLFLPPLLTLACASAAFSSTALASIDVTGRRAEALSRALARLGLNKFDQTDFMQVGPTACREFRDPRGTYFPGGAAGDTVGEDCLVYGIADDSDEDGVLRKHVIVPRDDREQSREPQQKISRARLRELREALEEIVRPEIRERQLTEDVLVQQRMSGVAGISCEGRDAYGVLHCAVKTSEICPPR